MRLICGCCLVGISGLLDLLLLGLLLLDLLRVLLWRRSKRRHRLLRLLTAWAIRHIRGRILISILLERLVCMRRLVGKVYLLLLLWLLYRRRCYWLSLHVLRNRWT